MASRLILALAALFGAAGVALMAAGSHAAGSNAAIAGQMLLFHAGAILAAEAARRAGLLRDSVALLAIVALIAGVALFSGDLALRAFKGARLFAMAAPTGGIVTILGWLTLAASALLAPRR